MADIVEVCRCKNCQHFIDKSGLGGAEIGQCDLHGGMYMFYEDFCSYGSRPIERPKVKEKKDANT